MKLKSLILGSSVAAISAVGAQAADAIVIAEPEPVEYVRVCDVYGAGFFYIPGTETCLRIGGEARFQVGAANDDDTTSWIGMYRSGDVNALIAGGLAPDAAFFLGSDTPNAHGFEPDTYNTEARGRFYIDARTQTEWGTLRGYVRVDASRGTAAIRTNKAFLELGGFKAGYEDSAWAFTPNAGAANYGSHSDSGLLYGYQQRNLIQYNFSGSNGFFATLSLEDDGINEFAGANAAAANPFTAPVAQVGYLGYSDRNYIPDVVLKAGVNQAWGAAWVTFGYDEDRTNLTTVVGANRLYTIADAIAGNPRINAVQGAGWTYGNQLGDSGWAAQAGVHLNVPSAPGSSFRLIGYYADSANAYNGHGGNWSILASYNHVFNQQFSASLGVQYVNNLYLPGTDIKTSRTELGKIDLWAAELSTVWEPVKNFQVRTETTYAKADGSDGTLSGFVRFSRFF